MAKEAQRRKVVWVNMRKFKLCLLAALILTGCAVATKQTDASMTSYDKDTEYAVIPKTNGFTLAINYSRYQFIPESEAVAVACKSALTAIAYELADKQGRKIEAINEQRIRLSMGRNGLSGITSCPALAVVEWKQ